MLPMARIALFALFATVTPLLASPVRDQNLEDTRREFRAIPCWSELGFGHEAERADILSRLRRLSRRDLDTLRRLVEDETKRWRRGGLGSDELGRALNLKALNQVTFASPLGFPVSLTRDSELLLTGVYGGWGGAFVDPLIEFDQFRKRYGRREVRLASASELGHEAEMVWVAKLDGDPVTMEHVFALLAANSIPTNALDSRGGVVMVSRSDLRAASCLIREDALTRGYLVELPNEEHLPNRLEWKRLSLQMPFAVAARALRRIDGVDFPRLLKLPQVKALAREISAPFLTAIEYRSRSCFQFNHKTHVRCVSVVQARVLFGGGPGEPYTVAETSAVYRDHQRGWKGL